MFPCKKIALTFNILLIGFCAAVFAVMGTEQDVKSLPPPATRRVDFSKDIEPIFSASCLVCHGPIAQRNNFRLDSREAVLKGGLSGTAIVPGKSADSLLVRLVAGLESDRLMPLGGARLSDEQIGLIRAWIDQGALWSRESTGQSPAAASIVATGSQSGVSSKNSTHGQRTPSIISCRPDSKRRD